MVFQNYAIFPNLTVGGNVAYGSGRAACPRRRSRSVWRARCGSCIWTRTATRWPTSSRAASFSASPSRRCLVIEPEVLLLDEPLSNLDAKLRMEMRAEIRQLQQQLKITAIYVTHDQEEALAMSDRIAVMRGGKLEQVARPQDIYRDAATPFVAEFMGAPTCSAALSPGGTARRCDRGSASRSSAPGKIASESRDVSFSLRPETIRLLDTGERRRPWLEVSRPASGRSSSSAPSLACELQIGNGAMLRVGSLGVLPDIGAPRP